jgi:hypothetical protein
MKTKLQWIVRLPHCVHAKLFVFQPGLNRSLVVRKRLPGTKETKVP